MAHLHESESFILIIFNIVYLLQYHPSDQSFYYEIDEIEGAADRDSLVYNDEYLSLIQ